MPVKFQLTPEQIEILYSPARFIGLFAGRRFGKTHCVRFRLIKRALQARNQELMFVAPLSAQAREVYRAIIRDNSVRHLITHKSERPYPEITYCNGSRIKFRSMQRPEGIRSTGEDEVVLDEIQDPVYKEEDIDAIIMPLIGDKRGTLLVSGQFRGFNWYHKRFFLAGQSQFKLDESGKPLTGIPNVLFKSWRIPSSRGIMFQGEEGRAELDLQRSLIPKAVWDQEWECIPSANIRAVFDYELLQYAANNSEQPHTAPMQGWRYVIGLDLGGKFDYSAIVVLAWNAQDKTAHVCDAYKFPLRTHHADQARKVAAIAQHWNACVVADNTGGATGGHGQVDAVFRFYRDNLRDLREFTFNIKTKSLLVRNMSLQIEQKRLTIPPQFTELHTQLQEYEWEYKNGLYRYGAPAGKHDDLAMALGLAIEGGLRNWTGGGNGSSLGAFLT